MACIVEGREGPRNERANFGSVLYYQNFLEGAFLVLSSSDERGRSILDPCTNSHLPRALGGSRPVFAAPSVACCASAPPSTTPHSAHNCSPGPQRIFARAC